MTWTEDGLSPYAPYIPDARPYSNDLYLPSYTKRAQWAQHTGGKRATLNQLLRRLVALYGDRDIHYSGRSSHVRFGAGGRR
ncbi:hypothetical protein DPMN_113612 [Dreissena polymorpha]|uniref:Uncharacterized protein n=1 Tax=Dreissena polymorpha TaxID=45954 RepID=A0A9D4KIK9_DREPO|nr:hypothetical protein DPMN_113612 [Dreissena polymorpha]